MKKLFLFFSLLVQIEGISQTYLNVPLISQKQSKWCWAASIEMILKYYNQNSSISQCDIANIYQGIMEGDICSFDSCKCDTSRSARCNNYFESRRNGGIAYRAKAIFEELGYNSTESGVDRLAWDDIKIQIDQCQPILLLVQRRHILNPEASFGQHCVVIDGYLEEHCNKFILIKDPWEPCNTGCKYALNYDSLLNTTSAMGVGTTLWVYDIKPKNGQNVCDVKIARGELPNIRDIMPCPKPDVSITINEYKNSPNTLVEKSLETILNCFPNIVPIATTLKNKDQINDLKRVRVLTIINKKMVNPNQYRKPFGVNKFLYYSPIDKFQVVVTYREKIQKNGCPTDQIDGYWLLETFGNCSYLCPYAAGACFLPSYVFLFNQYFFIPSFQIVYYSLYNYTFRKFRLKNRYYYYSTEPYKDFQINDNSYFKALTAYSETQVLARLHLKSIQSKP